MIMILCTTYTARPAALAPLTHCTSSVQDQANSGFAGNSRLLERLGSNRTRARRTRRRGPQQQRQADRFGLHWLRALERTNKVTLRDMKKPGSARLFLSLITDSSRIKPQRGIAKKRPVQRLVTKALFGGIASRGLHGSPESCTLKLKLEHSSGNRLVLPVVG